MGPTSKMTWTEVMMGDMFAAVVGIIIMFQEGRDE
jgi:hypothetical protein